MDQDGISPIHHENFDWTTFTATNKKVQLTPAVSTTRRARAGATQENQKITRFTLFNDIQRISGYTWVPNLIYECVSWRSNGTCRTRDWVDHGHDEPNYGPYASWAGCVEARPSPLQRQRR